MSRRSSQSMKPRTLEHIASALIPAASIIAVPNASVVFPKQKTSPEEEWQGMGAVILRASLASEQLVPAQVNPVSEDDDDDDEDDNEQEETSSRKTRSMGRMDASTDDDSDDDDEEDRTQSRSKSSTTKSSSTPKRPPLTVTERRLFGHEDPAEKSQSTTVDPGLSSTIRLDAKPAPPQESARSTTTTTTTSTTNEGPNKNRVKVTVTRQFVPPLVVNPIPSQTIPDESRASTRADTLDSEARSSINDSTTVPNTARSVSFKEPVVVQTYEPSSSKSSTTVINRPVRDDHDQQKLQDLEKENQFLRDQVDKLAALNRREQEEFRQKLHNAQKLSRDETMNLLRTSGQDQLKRLEEAYEKSQERCKQLQSELNALKERSGQDSDRSKSDELRSEMKSLKQQNYRLTIALSEYQAKYSPEALKAEKKDQRKIEGLPSKGPTPIWVLDRKYLSPLCTYYESKIEEKDEFIKHIQRRCQELENQVRSALAESILSQGRTNLAGSHDLEQIKQLAHSVLEENKVLQEKLLLQTNELNDARKVQSEEVLNLTRQIMVAEREKLSHERTIETLRMKNEELHHQYDRLILENDHRMNMNDHLREIHELQRSMEEIQSKHRSEMELLLRRVQDAEAAKKSVQMKIIDQRNDLQRMKDELKETNKLNRKLQIRVQTFEKKLELQQMKEQTTSVVVEQLEQQRSEQEKNTSVMAKTYEEEMEKLERQIELEKKKSAELERQLENSKSHTKQRLQDLQESSKKQIELLKSRCTEYELRLQQLSTVLAEKQIQIDGFHAEKRNFEVSLEHIWLTGNADNKRMHEQLRDMRVLT